MNEIWVQDENLNVNAAHSLHFVRSYLSTIRLFCEMQIFCRENVREKLTKSNSPMTDSQIERAALHLMPIFNDIFEEKVCMFFNIIHIAISF